MTSGALKPEEQGPGRRGVAETAATPSIPRLLLWLLGRSNREHVAGDLSELYVTEVGPASGRLRGRLWLWKSFLVAAVLGFFGNTRNGLARGLRRHGSSGYGRTGGRDVRRRNCLGQLLQDLRYATRSLLAHPDFTIVALLTVALGVGGSTAIFSVVNAVLLRPLPYEEPDRLAILLETGPDGGSGPFSGPDFLDWREAIQSFDVLSAFYPMDFNLSGGDEPVSVIGALVTPGTFELLGSKPSLGRTFLPEDAETDRNFAAILSHGLWTRSFGADPAIVGKEIEVGGVARTVVGVMPSEFDLPTLVWLGHPYEIYLPLSDLTLSQQRGWRRFSVIGRLRDGVLPAEASAEMDALAEALGQQYPRTNANTGARLVSLHHEVVGGVDRPLLMLLGATGLVLLIVCGNVGGLLLAKATARHSETTIRVALGATRARLIRQHLAESVLLSLIGGAGGFLLAVWGVDILISLFPPGLPRAAEIGVDGWVLGFAVSVSLLSGIAFGITPAIAASRADLAGSLRTGDSRGLSPTRHRLRSAHVVAQVALALMLTHGAALMLVSYVRVTTVERGFDLDNVLTVGLSLQGPDYDTDLERITFLQEVLSRLRSVPGMVSAGAVSKLPLEGGSNTQVLVEGREAEFDPNDAPLIELSRTFPGYFRAMGIPLIHGRDLTDADFEIARPGVVINQELARRLWPGEDPIGARISYEADPPHWLTVVGVVADVRQWGLESDPWPEIYVPFSLLPRPHMHLVLRSRDDPKALVSTVKSEVWAVNEDLPIAEIRTMEDVIADDLSMRRFNTLLICLFALVALVLVAAGVYGVMSYYVAHGTREIGVHMALGAGPSDVLEFILGRGSRLALVGAALGLLGALISAVLLASMVHGISPVNLPTLVLAGVFVVGVALAGALVPALRAIRVDPCDALKWE